MNQQKVDFNNDINEPNLSIEENQIVDQIVAEYLSKRNNTIDEKIITQIFFEKHCIEISKRLKSKGFFDGEWDLIENSFGKSFVLIIKNNKYINNSTLTEFIILLINKLEVNFTPLDFQNNSTNNFVFDRKITEGILHNINNRNIDASVLSFIGYVKIWNQYKIYNNPFNNNKALLIHRIFSEKIWPLDQITYNKYSIFEKAVQQFFDGIKNIDLYVPFFDKKNNTSYSVSYIEQRKKLNDNIMLLFDFENTDEYESYNVLISNLLNNPIEDVKAKLIALINIKINNSNKPLLSDLDSILDLYRNLTYQELAKSILRRFYLYNYLQY